MNRHFQAVPEIPTGLQAWEATFMTALKQNAELLAGFRDPAHTAVLKGDVTTTTVDSQGVTGEYQRVYGVNSTGSSVVDYGNIPTYNDYEKLATEVSLLRQALNDLITRIR